MIEETLSVPTISCGHCRSTIEGAVGRLAGVAAVTVNVARKQVTARYDRSVVGRDAVVAAIEGAGYEVAAPPARAGGCCG